MKIEYERDNIKISSTILGEEITGNGLLIMAIAKMLYSRKIRIESESITKESRILEFETEIENKYKELTEIKNEQVRFPIPERERTD